MSSMMQTSGIDAPSKQVEDVVINVNADNPVPPSVHSTSANQVQIPGIPTPIPVPVPTRQTRTELSINYNLYFAAIGVQFAVLTSVIISGLIYAVVQIKWKDDS